MQNKQGSIRVLVKPEHFEDSDSSAYRSPVALAIRDRLSKPANVVICFWHGHVRIGERIYTIPDDVSLSEQSGKPFEFRISNTPCWTREEFREIQLKVQEERWLKKSKNAKA